MDLSTEFICAAYILSGNIFLYIIIHRYATDTVTFAAKALITFSLFCCLSALVLLNIDVYQSLNNTFTFDLVNLWRFFYWTSFLFGYIIFVILSEHDRLGSGSSWTAIWINFYRQRLPWLISALILSVLFVVFLLKKNFLLMSAYKERHRYSA